VSPSSDPFSTILWPQPALAVAADGRALALLPTPTGPQVAERPPEGAFGPAEALPGAADVADQVTVALSAGGGAIAAWRAAGGGAVRAATRGGPGPFGAVTTIAPPLLASERWLLGVLPSLFGVGTASYFPYSFSDPLKVATTGDGRALLAWGGASSFAGGAWLAPHVATVPLAGGAIELQSLGGPLRHAAFVTPLLLAGGTPAVAWADDGSAGGSGRLQLAIEGAARSADPQPPRLRVASAGRALRAKDPLVLKVTCSAACDVRASVPSASDAEGTLSLAKAGSGWLSIAPARVLRRPPR
jgi:hypothetical protein